MATQEYITFELESSKTESSKTSLWYVMSASQQLIGTIAWNGRWRRYCFYPAADTVWSAGCLERVQDFILTQMEQRKLARKQAS